MGIYPDPLEPLQVLRLSDKVLELIDAAIVVLDRFGQIISWNQAVAAISGIPAQQSLGSLFPSIALLAEDLEVWNREFVRVLAGLPSARREYRWRGPDGSIRPFVCSTVAVRDNTGVIAHVAMTVTVKASTASSRLEHAVSLSTELIRERFLERRDMSHFLHGTITQNLVALSFSVTRLQTFHPGGPAADVNRTLELIDSCCRDVRVMSYMLAPPVRCDSGLQNVIETFVDYVREETGLTIDLNTVPVPEGISNELNMLFFALVQEWAARAIRTYPGAKLSIRLETSGRTDTKSESPVGVVLELESTPAVQPTGHGGMSDAILDGWAMFRACARDLGGHFEVSCCPTRAFARMAFQEVCRS